MIELNQALIIHQIVIEKFGGDPKVRDLNLLKSALNRPYVTFDKKDLYVHPIDKAAALIESIIINHPFVDGNKRTGYMLMRLFLLECDYDIQASQEEKYQFVLGIASGNNKIEEISNWLKKHTFKLK